MEVWVVVAIVEDYGEREVADREDGEGWRGGEVGDACLELLR